MTRRVLAVSMVISAAVTSDRSQPFLDLGLSTLSSTRNAAPSRGEIKDDKRQACGGQHRERQGLQLAPNLDC